MQKFKVIRHGAEDWEFETLHEAIQFVIENVHLYKYVDDTTDSWAQREIYSVTAYDDPDPENDGYFENVSYTIEEVK